MNYLRDHGATRATPQSSPIPGAETPQVPNSAGGHAWQVDRWSRLRRFLILGSEGGSYYAGERELTLENVDCLYECVREDNQRTVDEVVAISEAGRAPKNDAALYALAYVASHAREAGRRYALDALPRVARTGTHLFQFVEYAETMRGWGRGLRRGVGAWYMRTVEEVAFQAAKYRQRGGWTHRDILRLAHPAPPTPEHQRLYGWIVGKSEVPIPPAGASRATTGWNEHRWADENYGSAVVAYERAQAAASPTDTAALIREYGQPSDRDTRISREQLRPEHLTDPEVWRALIDVGMPQTALLRNLANMTRLGLLGPGSPQAARVIAQLTDPARLVGSRVHPFAVLTALATYRSGRGQGNAWTPEPQVTAALDRAFYAAFGAVEPSGARTLVALDVSGSMGHPIVAGRSVSPLSAREGGAALAMVTASTEPTCHTVCFSRAGDWRRPYTALPPGFGRISSINPQYRETGLAPLDLAGRRLDDVLREVEGLPFGGTDCALPMLYAADRGLEVDLFVVLTDSETWAGEVHPAQALQLYRQRTGIDARLAVVAMASNGFSIASPDDPGMLDVVGFDTATPGIVAAFARGEL